MDEQVGTLGASPLFAALDDAARDALRDRMDEVRLPRGGTLFSEGDPGDRLYVVTSGKVKLGRTAGDGRETLLAVLGPGEMFGELSLFDPGPRTATATAVTDTTLLPRLADAEHQLSAYRRSLHERLDAATGELISRYRDEPSLAMQSLPLPRTRAKGVA